MGVPVSPVKGLSKPRCSGMCVPVALQGETPKARSRAGGVAPALLVWGRAGPLLPGVCVSLHSSARAPWLFPQHGQMLAGCRGEEPPLGAMPLGGVGGKALSHFWRGAYVLDGPSSTLCRHLWVWLRG